MEMNLTKEQHRIAVIGTGGTISYVGRDGLDIVRYVETRKIYEVDELLNAFPETLEQSDLVPVRLRAMPSTLIGPAEWLECLKSAPLGHIEGFSYGRVSGSS